MVWPTLGSRKAKEQNRTCTVTVLLDLTVKAKFFILAAFKRICLSFSYSKFSTNISLYLSNGARQGVTVGIGIRPRSIEWCYGLTVLLFLPRNAMLARYMLWPRVCPYVYPSIYHKSVLYQNS